jgi:hypothetical protein
VDMTSVRETVFTVAEVAERLKVNEETVRPLFVDEPGAIVIRFPRNGKRLPGDRSESRRCATAGTDPNEPLRIRVPDRRDPLSCRES